MPAAPLALSVFHASPIANVGAFATPAAPNAPDKRDHAVTQAIDLPPPNDVAIRVNALKASFAAAAPVNAPVDN